MLPDVLISSLGCFVALLLFNVNLMCKIAYSIPTNVISSLKQSLFSVYSRVRRVEKLLAIAEGTDTFLVKSPFHIASIESVGWLHPDSTCTEHAVYHLHRTSYTLPIWRPPKIHICTCSSRNIHMIGLWQNSAGFNLCSTSGDLTVCMLPQSLCWCENTRSLLTHSTQWVQCNVSESLIFFFLMLWRWNNDQVCKR